MVTPPFHYELDHARAVLTLHGELDDPATSELRSTIATASSKLTTDLAIDLADVSFMPSPAIGVFATAMAEARRHGATVTLVAPEGSVAARLLTICALDYGPAPD